MVDDRQPGKVRHTLEDLLGQRIFGIACGHPDRNDADRLGDAPIHKLLLERDAASTAWARTQVTWLRDQFLTLGSTSSLPCGASSSTCQPRRQTSTRGDTSPSHLAPGPANPPLRGALTCYRGGAPRPQAELSLPAPCPGILTLFPGFKAAPNSCHGRSLSQPRSHRAGNRNRTLDE